LLAMASKTIVICSSGSFYEHCNQLADKLRAAGFTVVVPATAYKMLESGEYNIAKVKKWLDNAEHFHLKRNLAMAHFKEVANGDAILIVNDDKPGKPSYIGPNTTMEWGLAYYLGKPVFILNGVAKQSNYYEEVYGMATVIDGDLGKIKL
jgi:nucleoside 2-deoxyribosyltransferase